MGVVAAGGAGARVELGVAWAPMAVLSGMPHGDRAHGDRAAVRKRLSAFFLPFPWNFRAQLQLYPPIYHAADAHSSQARGLRR
jgi:hypothetical protein